MIKTNVFVTTERVGMAPMDIAYMGEIELTGKNDEKLYVQACFMPDGLTVFAVSKYSIKTDDIPDNIVNVEEYDSLLAAEDSEYFQYFLELDRMTDEKLEETMLEIDDTKNYGMRISGNFTSAGCMMFAEAYNSQQPEYYEYIQVRQTPDGYIYSGSHRSCFMHMQLNGDKDEGFYNLYFGKKDPPLYFFKVTSLDDLGKYEYFRRSFEEMIKIIEKKN